MLVTNSTISGTIGGGELEFQAINQARSALGRNHRKTISLDQALGPNLGQCCGGSVKVVIDFHDEAPVNPTVNKSHVTLFGAGHVGQAVAQALAPLPFDIDWIDSRLDTPAEHQLDAPQNWIGQAPEHSNIIIMTHSHAMDLDICFAALSRECFPYVGMIGSRTKRARFNSRLAQAGLTDEVIERLICPIGVQGIRSKHPAAIAASVAAQLMMKHEENTGLFG